MTDIARPIALVAIVLSLPLASTRADTSAALIKDIRPGPTGSSPNQLIDVDGTLFFTADDDVAGNELWKSDGTEAGTVLVKDIVPGPDGSSCMSLTKVGGTLFFTARDDATGTELWKSDGTEAGTVLVKDIIPGVISSSPSDLIDFNGTLIFVARVPTGATNRELLKSDGTAEGTVLVNDLGYPYPPRFPGLGFNSYMTVVNDTVFFKAEPSSYNYTGYELWKTDGTALGTVMVRDINPGPGDSTPSVLTDVNGTLFFAADQDATGFELWRSDGTEAGTVMVKDIFPGILGSFGYDPDAVSMIEFGNKLYFNPDDGVHGRELWVSDGTPAGTVLIRDVRPGPDSSGSDPGAVVGDMLFFVANDGVNGSQLWKTDGTTGGTVPVGIVASSSPGGLTEFDGILFFAARSAATGVELWLSDGTADGTFLVDDINPGPGSAYPWSLTESNGTLLFGAFDDANGSELWLVDCPRENWVCGDPFTVNSVGDLDDQTPDGFCDTGNMVGGEHECTLRAAIQEANATADPQKIDFEIPPGQATGGVFIIDVGSSLPIITDPAVIDATTQQEYQQGAPVVELKGPGGNNPLWGLQINAGSTIIRGFSIYGFGRNGILMEIEGGNVIESNIVGTNAQSVPEPGNGEHGIEIRNSSNNVIGGSEPAKRNVVSNNGRSGTGGCGIAMTTSADNRVSGNNIGTDVTGMTSLANIKSGVCLVDAGFNFIGGTGANEGNIISGNGVHGIHIASGQSSMNSILGNIVGLDRTGDGVVANGRDGVVVDQAGSGNLIGDGTPGGRNTISGNARDGVVVNAGVGFNHVSGNLIGSNATGQVPRPNQNGILVRDSMMNLIGVNGGNTISGNTGHGIFVTGDSSGSTQIQDNHIGTDTTGFMPLGNWLDGVRLAGVRDAGINGNIIADNGGYGVAILGADELGITNPNQANAGNVVSSNFVGADPAGGVLGNGIDGITINDSSRNHVSDNLIQSNGSAGISVVHQTWGDGNLITGNAIVANIALGIDLGADYVTPNDAMDADTGANALQNFPEITNIVGHPLNRVQGALHSTPNRTFTVEIFSNTAADPSGYGEGEVFEGAFTVTTDAGGDGLLRAGFGIGQSGDCITATARDDSTGDTSEFSTCVTIPPPPPPVDLDFGDAPDAGGRYPTLLAGNGARHWIDIGVHLGSLVDGDSDGQPNANATGDDGDGIDDEDGVNFVEPFVTLSSLTRIQASVSATGFLDAWVDFNGDGDWSDASDQIFASEPLVAGVNALSFVMPGDAIAGTTFARFRFSTEGGLGPIGPAMDGEVEDYPVEIIGHETVVFIDGFESGDTSAWSTTAP